jgi:hypothetical protein
MEWVVSVTPRSRVTHGERAPSTHWIGGWCLIPEGCYLHTATVRTWNLINSFSGCFPWLWNVVRQHIPDTCSVRQKISYNGQTDACRLQHGVTYVGSCIVTALCVVMNPVDLHRITTISKYFNMSLRDFSITLYFDGSTYIMSVWRESVQKYTVFVPNRIT